MTFKSIDDAKESFDVTTNERDFKLQQDVQMYKDYAAGSRERDSYLTGARSSTYRPFCIIPDIVAIDLKVKYDIDIHDPSFMDDQAKKMKFAHIMRTEFPELLTSRAGNLSNTGGNSGIIIK